MSDLVGNPEDRFSCVAAHMFVALFIYSVLYRCLKGSVGTKTAIHAAYQYIFCTTLIHKHFYIFDWSCKAFLVWQILKDT